ncbi:MAG: hypothetical protein IKL05_01940 [Clostridia bacterium]|nr:hypothetical protein [Clostridia bacterium]
MKKILSLLSTLALCAVLLSCADNTKVATPNESPTPYQPEIVEPEVVNPEVIKPEVVEPERNEWLDQDEQILPAEDENTKVIIIPYPEDFTFGYIEPEIVSPEEFEWGDYMPFVRYSVGSMGEVGSPVYDYAILGNGVVSIDEGHRLYEEFSRKYKKTLEYYDNDTIDGFPLSDQQDAIPLISQSRIIWISTDASQVGNYYLKHAGTGINSVYNREYTLWDGIYELYENGKLASETTVADDNGYLDFNDGELLGWSSGAYTSPDATQRIWYTQHGYNDILDLHKNTDELFLFNMNVALIYDLDETKLKYKIVFDYETAPSGRNYSINQFIDGRYLVITFYSDMGPEEACHNVYLYDLEEEKMEKINGYCFNPLVSPDRKFLIYSTPTWQSTAVNSRINWDYHLRSGFYIKNLESGETTFYEYDSEHHNAKYTGSTQSINWVNEERLKASID